MFNNSFITMIKDLILPFYLNLIYFYFIYNNALTVREKFFINRFVPIDSIFYPIILYSTVNSKLFRIVASLNVIIFKYTFQ